MERMMRRRSGVCKRPPYVSLCGKGQRRTTSTPWQATWRSAGVLSCCAAALLASALVRLGGQDGAAPALIAHPFLCGKHEKRGPSRVGAAGWAQQRRRAAVPVCYMWLRYNDATPGAKEVR